jgi:hypothetical protein
MEAAQVICMRIYQRARAGTSSSDFVYLYCHFGHISPSEGGFEEWSRAVAPIPEAGTFFPVIGLMVAVFSTYELRRRKIKQMGRWGSCRPRRMLNYLRRKSRRTDAPSCRIKFRVSFTETAPVAKELLPLTTTCLRLPPWHRCRCLLPIESGCHYPPWSGQNQYR